MALRAHGSKGEGQERVVIMVWGKDIKDLQDFEFVCECFSISQVTRQGVTF